MIRNRITKMHFLRATENGDFRVATNHLALFPYYKAQLANSTKRNSSFHWNIGLDPRNKHITMPKVRSLQQEYDYHNEGRIEQVSRVFEALSWQYVHIEIPIYKYWVIYVIQICCPLLILSVVSMFIFLQENGRDSEGSSNIINLRIANSIEVLLAYSLMIPVFKESTSAATSLSFFYLAIYLSVLPLILVLSRSLLDSKMLNADWKLTYMPFLDPFFLGSLVLLAIILTAVLIVIVVASFISYQVDGRPTKTSFVKFKEAKEPSSCLTFMEETNRLRNNQYRYEKIVEVDCYGGIVPDLDVFGGH